MTELVIDVPRLRKELEYVTAHREQWKQGSWINRTSCGTVACLAGNTVLNEGCVPAYGSGSRAVTSTVITQEGRWLHVADVAAKLLGLTTHQADVLFDASNSLFGLWSIAAHLTDGEIEIPPEVYDEAAGLREAPEDGTSLSFTDRLRGMAIRRNRAITEIADLM